MKCTIIKASPRGQKAGSSLAADAFIQGMRKEGAEIEEVLLREKEIRHCTGCYTCWTKTPGRCIHRDDMDSLLPRISESDLTVFATPLYTYSVPGMLKDFLDRNLPLSQPYLIESGETTGHPSRREREGKIFIISTAGFPEKGHFDGMMTMFHHLAGGESGITGSILLPGAETIANDLAGEEDSSLYRIIEQAGREVILNGAISKETIQALEENEKERLISAENFREIANAYWKSLQPDVSEDLNTGGQFLIPGRGDRPCTLSHGGLESLIGGMSLSYNPEASPGLRTVYQFDFGKEFYYLLIQDGKCTAYAGTYPHPACTVQSPPEVWEAVSNGTLSGSEALISGKYTVTGDMAMFMKMDRLFSTASEKTNIENVEEKTGKREGPIEKLPGGLQLTLGFLPWMLLWILSPIAGEWTAALSALTVSLLFSSYRILRKRILFFEAGTALFLIFHGIMLFSGSAAYQVSSRFFQYMFLAGLWAISLVRKECLTAEYSGMDFPDTAKKTPAFIETNRILTAVWSLYYLFSGMMVYLAGSTGSSVAELSIVPYFALAPMFLFTAWFQRWYPGRLMKSLG